MMLYVRRGIHDKTFLFFFLCAVLLILLPVFAPWIAPNDPIANDYSNALISGSSKYPLGTDPTGRCILSRLIYGGRTSLLIVFWVVAIIAVLGIVIGIISGYLGGRTDMVITRIIDIVVAIPSTVFVIALVSVLGSSLKNTVLAMSLVGWTDYARVTRALVLSVRENEYIAEARLGGLNSFQIIRRYIVPNVLPHLLVNITQDIGENLLVLSGLSLLGLASQPPTPEWGFMLSEGRKYMQSAPWMIIYPGMMIVLHVMVFNLLGDRLRDILDPRYDGPKRRRKNK